MTSMRLDGETTKERISAGAQRADFYYLNRKKRMGLMVVEIPLLASLLNIVIGIFLRDKVMTLHGQGFWIVFWCFIGSFVLAMLYAVSFFMRLPPGINEIIFVRLKEDDSYWRVNLPRLAFSMGQNLPGVNPFYISNHAKLSPEKRLHLENMIYDAIHNSAGVHVNSIVPMTEICVIKEREWHNTIVFTSYGRKYKMNVPKLYKDLPFADEAHFQNKREKILSLLIGAAVILLFVLPLEGVAIAQSHLPQLPQLPMEQEKKPQQEKPDSNKTTVHTLDGISFSMPESFINEMETVFIDEKGEQLYNVSVLPIETQEDFLALIEQVKADIETVPGFRSYSAKVEDALYGKIANANNFECLYNIYTIKTTEKFVCHQALLYCPDAKKAVSIVGASSNRDLGNQVKKQTESIFLSISFNE